MNFQDCRCLIAEVLPGQEDKCFGSMSIGSTQASTDAGAQLVLEGIKTTTSSPVWEFPDGLGPYPGALSVLVDGSGRARAIVETMRVEMKPFGQVSEEFALAYGEGDRTLSWFKVEMGRWYKNYADSTGNSFDDETKIICEWIKVKVAL
jgi:histidinol-phosphate aminotransferase